MFGRRFLNPARPRLGAEEFQASLHVPQRERPRASLKIGPGQITVGPFYSANGHMQVTRSKSGAVTYTVYVTGGA